MERAVDDFDFQAVLRQVQEACYGVLCHIMLDFAWHGLIVAVVLMITGFALRKSRLAICFKRIARLLAIACCGFALPGVINYLITHSLPPVGLYSLNNFNSIGYFSLWSLISAHMLGEETNYQFWVRKQGNQESAEELANSDLDTAEPIGNLLEESASSKITK
jgi:hypothetical protein